MVALIQSRSLELHRKQTYQTCQFNASTLLFASLSLNTDLKKKRQTDARFMDDALKTRAIKYLNSEIWLLFSPTKTSYAPASNRISEQNESLLSYPCLVSHPTFSR